MGLYEMAKRFLRRRAIFGSRERPRDEARRAYIDANFSSKPGNRRRARGETGSIIPFFAFPIAVRRIIYTTDIRS
jgi:hypothetical protein